MCTAENLKFELWQVMTWQEHGSAMGLLTGYINMEEPLMEQNPTSVFPIQVCVGRGLCEVQKGGKSCMVAFDSAAGEYLYNTGAHCRRYLPPHTPVETTPESLLDRGKQKQRNNKQ